jgi:transposase
MDIRTENRIKTMLPFLNKKQRRLYLATEAQAIGYGGVSQLSRLSGVSRITITKGIQELKTNQLNTLQNGRCRKEGSGRKKVTERYPNIVMELKEIIEPHTKGSPENPLLWTSKSVRNLQMALEEKEIKVSHRTICDVLKSLGYTLQSNRKALALKESHPDRNTQFEYINEQAKTFISENEPVISIDAKKKENIGNFKNNGAEYQKKKTPIKVLDHDFPLKEKGKAIPYGVYDLAQNKGFVNVGISNETAEFAANSIVKWWAMVGAKTYPNATKMMITADCGGSNGYRVRLWKVKLQEIANQLNIVIYVTHFPPGTSKWNKIEHRLFSYITINWRGKPLDELLTVVNLIASTTTTTGLTVECVSDLKEYKKGIVVSDEELHQVNIIHQDFHGEWNYMIYPNLRSLFLHSSKLRPVQKQLVTLKIYFS